VELRSAEISLGAMEWNLRIKVTRKQAMATTRMTANEKLLRNLDGAHGFRAGCTYKGIRPFINLSVNHE
jgi:hypothetical protein